jgi:HK97 gp10 family phage protein
MSSVTGKRSALIARTSARRASVSGITDAITLDSSAFMASLQRHLAQMEVATEDKLVVVGIQIQNAARSLCPVDTGRLRSSIIMTKGRDSRGFYVEIGTNVKYAAFVEFGTSKQRAQPYLLPAVAMASGFMRAA